MSDQWRRTAHCSFTSESESGFIVTFPTRPPSDAQAPILHHTLGSLVLPLPAPDPAVLVHGADWSVTPQQDQCSRCSVPPPCVQTIPSRASALEHHCDLEAPRHSPEWPPAPAPLVLPGSDASMPGLPVRSVTCCAHRT